MKNDRKTVVSEKFLDLQAAKNQGRWSMPKLKIRQCCAIMIRMKCVKFQVFEIVNMSILTCKICLKMTFLGSDFGFPYLVIVGQIQVKLVSAQTS